MTKQELQDELEYIDNEIEEKEQTANFLSEEIDNLYAERQDILTQMEGL